MSTSMERSARKTHGRRVTLAVGVLTLALGGGAVHNIAGDLVARHATAQERELGQALDVAFHTSGAAVICESPAGMDSLLPWYPPSTLRSLGVPLTKTIWLSQSTCDILSDLRAKPLTAADFDESAPGYDNLRTARAREALRTAAHEAVHSLFNQGDESKTECYAFQMAPKLAEALGMDPSLADRVRVEVIQVEEVDHSAEGGVPRQYRFKLNDCRMGGKLDLTPGVRNAFPAQP
ncbi:MAG TPA: hypothetical protein VKQ34_04520 [Candidatus Saccharimonadales bacterium]|nr:hypothetical protein [Candidatus Saccharimonadales bacterium]